MVPFNAECFRVKQILDYFLDVQAVHHSVISAHGIVSSPSSEASDCMVKQPENLKSFVQQWARS